MYLSEPLWGREKPLCFPLILRLWPVLGAAGPLAWKQGLWNHRGVVRDDVREPDPWSALLAVLLLGLGLAWAPAGCIGVWPDARNDDASAGDDDDSTGGDDDSAGDDDTSVGDDDTSVGDDDTSVGDDDTSVGDDDTSAGDDDTAVGDDDASGDDDSSGGGDSVETWAPPGPVLGIAGGGCFCAVEPSAMPASALALLPVIFVRRRRRRAARRDR